MKHDIDRIIAGIDPGPESEDGLTAGARELMGEITALPRPAAGRARSRRRLIVPLVAGLAVATVVLSWLLPAGLGTRPASALDIRREGGFYVVTVKQLFADHRRYERELRQRGVHVSLRVIPVSPGLVGTVLPPFDDRYNGLTNAQIARRPDLISPIEPPGACAEAWSCVIGLRIPVGYKGDAEIGLGRRARLGERFMAFGQLSNKGEPLQCTSFVNRTVDQVRAMLTAHGVSIGRYAVARKGLPASVPGDWYVHEGWLTEPGKALLVVGAARKAPAWPLDPGCAKRP